jgi:hypothetical protein
MNKTDVYINKFQHVKLSLELLRCSHIAQYWNWVGLYMWGPLPSQTPLPIVSSMWPTFFRMDQASSVVIRCLLASSSRWHGCYDVQQCSRPGSRGRGGLNQQPIILTSTVLPRPRREGVPAVTLSQPWRRPRGGRGPCQPCALTSATSRFSSTMAS